MDIKRENSLIHSLHLANKKKIKVSSLKFEIICIAQKNSKSI